MAIFSKEKLQKLEAAEKKAQKKHTVLIVDDEEANLVAMASILESDYNLLRAMNGDEALEIIKNMDHPERVCLVISDQRMPGMTGVMLFQQLAELIPKTIRIIVTGFIDVEAIIDSVNKANIYKFILKPFDRVELLWTITRAVEAFELQQQLDAQLQTLEDRVVERTQELESKNTELSEAYKNLKELSLVDSLTMLYNRRFLITHLDSDIAISARKHVDWINGGMAKPLKEADLLFFIVTIDDFDQLVGGENNSEHDQILMNIRDVLLGVFRESDFLIRWSEEEFLIVVRFIDRQHAPELGERLRSAFAEHRFVIQGMPSVTKTCSIGFACFPFEPTKPEMTSWVNLVDVARICMCAARVNQGNAWLGVDSTEEADIENLVQHFIEEPQQMLAQKAVCLKTSIDAGTTLNWDRVIEVDEEGDED